VTTSDYKRVSIKTICYLLFASTTLFLVQGAQGVEWISIGEDISGNEWFYDTENVRVLQRGIIKAWLKITYSDQGRNMYIQQLDKYGWETKKSEPYEELSYSLNLIEVNCATRETRLMLVSNYSPSHVLDSVDTKQLPLERWEPFADESVGELLYKTVCALKAVK
jgi:hypothetical protein